MGSRLTEVFYCDHPGCQTISWLGNGSDWKMCEIVFGVHPKIIHKRHKEGGRNSIVKVKLNFCREHHSKYREGLYYLIAKQVLKGAKITGQSCFIEDLGCWVTIHDCLSPGEPIKNFQLSYTIFEEIFNQFMELSGWKDPAVVQKIMTLQDMPSSADL